MNDVTEPPWHSDRDSLLRLEQALRRLPQVEIEPAHTFAKGLYARTITIPKGTVLTGKIHKHSHLNVILRGDISVLTEHGVQRFTGPCVLVSSAGIKRAGYTHEETVWMTVHATEQTDLKALEDELIAPSFDALDATTVDADYVALLEKAG